MLSLTAILSLRCMGVMGVVVLVAMAILAMLVAMLMGRGMAWHGRRGAARTRAGRVIESDGRPNASDSSFGHTAPDTPFRSADAGPISKCSERKLHSTRPIC